MIVTRDRAELAMPVLLAGIGLAALVGGIGYGMTDDAGRVGTGFLPVVAGAALAVLAIADLVSVRRRQTAVARGGECPETTAGADPRPNMAADTVPSSDPDLDIRGRTAHRRVRALVVVAVLLVLAVLLVPVVGFLLSFAALLLLITAVVEKMGVLSSIVVTVVATALIWGVFVRFLSVPLPQGMLGVL